MRSFEAGSAEPSREGKPYEIWLEKYTKKLGRSHEDCVSHHQDNYDGVLPVWAAVEIVDLGSLRYLFRVLSEVSAGPHMAQHLASSR